MFPTKTPGAGNGRLLRCSRKAAHRKRATMCTSTARGPAGPAPMCPEDRRPPGSVGRWATRRSTVRSRAANEDCVHPSAPVGLRLVMGDVGAFLTLAVGDVPVYVAWRSGADVGWTRPGPFRIVKVNPPLNVSASRNGWVALPSPFTPRRDGVIRPHAWPRLRGGPGGALHPARWR